MVAELNGSTPLISQSAAGHDREPFKSISHLQDAFPPKYILILSFLLLQNLPSGRTSKQEYTSEVKVGIL